MDDRPKFFITDVFGERRYSGNQLATFLNCRALSDREMQQIAREINFSETTFVLSDEQNDGGYDVRIFTPEAEIDFAGHPTLGTAYIIQQHIIQQPVEKVVLNLKVGQVPVEFSAEQATDEMLWMQQVAPTFGEVLDVGIIAQVLSLNEDDIDSRWPIEQVSTGLPHIIVPLKSLDALKRTNVMAEFYWKLVNQSWAKIILVFCPEGYTEQHDLGVRVFPIWYGITEDPATGSGNGCLAAFLVKHRYFQSDSIDIVVGQGYEIGRPSFLSLRARQGDGHIGVIVGGRVLPIAEGRCG